MPYLQELFQDIEFDKFDIERLAESLLEDVSSNLEASDSSTSTANAKSKGSELSLSEPMVGSDDTRMEPAKDIRSVNLLEGVADDDEVKSDAIVDETYEKSQIIYGDDIPVDDQEECLEIMETQDICLKLERSDELISPIPSFEDEYLKSPMHTTSDNGYESHGSPLSQDFHFNEPHDDLNYLLNDLFPTLA